MQNGSAQKLSTRRVHDRASLAIEVSLESDHNFFVGLSENISEGGLFVATHRILEIGSTLELSMMLPGSQEPVTLHAVVRWTRLYNESSDVPPGMGVQFVDVPPRVMDTIRAFVMLRPALFWE